MRSAEKQTLTHGVIWKQLLLFFWPILIGTFFQQLYNTVDAVIVGNVVGKEALAAVGGTTGTLINLLVGFFIGLASGATVIISQYYGADDPERASKAVHTAAALCLVSGAALTVFGMLLSRTLLGFMSTPADVLTHALPYLRIVFAGMLPVMIYNIGTGMLRAVGDSRRPLLILIAACGTNIALDLVFIAGLRLGTAGAAIATVLSQTFAAALILRNLLTRRDCIRLTPSKLGFSRKQLAKILRIGLPAGFQSVMYSMSNAIIQAAINGFSTDVLAGWTAYGKVDGLYWMIVSAFGIAITTFVGQNWGAGERARARRAIRECFLMTGAVTLLLVVFLLRHGQILLRLFTANGDVLAQAMHVVRRMAPFYAAYIPIEILSGAMRGTGDTVIPTLMTLVGVCLLRVVWVLGIAPGFHSFDAVIASYPITWILTSILFIVYYFLRSPVGRRRRKAHA